MAPPDTLNNSPLRKRGLGRGLANLLSSTVPVQGSSLLQVRELSLEDVRPSDYQPRSLFQTQELQELAESIRTHGVLQPILVIPILGTRHYRIVAGERRYRASKLAGLTTIPVQVCDEKIDKNQAFMLALVENVQREDLSPIEEAKAYQWLLETTNGSQETLAKQIGKDRSTIANALRLLKLHPQVLHALEQEDISVGHAKILCGVPYEQQSRYVSEIKSRKLSVRMLEDVVGMQVQVRRSTKRKSRQSAVSLDPQFIKMCKTVEEKFSTRILLAPLTPTRGRLIVYYHDLKLLTEILDGLTKTVDV